METEVSDLFVVADFLVKMSSQKLKEIKKNKEEKKMWIQLNKFISQPNDFKKRGARN